MAADSGILGEAPAALASMAVRRRSRELSLTSASTLVTLERTGPRRLTDLAASEGLTLPSMTAVVVSQLEGLGFAEPRADPLRPGLPAAQSSASRSRNAFTRTVLRASTRTS